MWSGTGSTDIYCAKLNDTAGSQHLALHYIRVHPNLPILRIYTASIFVWSWDLDNDKGSYAFDQRCLSRILRIHNSQHVTNAFQKASLARSHSPCLARDGSLPSSLWRHQHPSITRLEKATRTPGSHLDPYCGGWSKTKQLWPLLCLASRARQKRVEPTCADSYAPVQGPILMMMRSVAEIEGFRFHRNNNEISKNKLNYNEVSYDTN